MTFEINSLVPEFWCTDFDASLDFYTKTLGFEVAQRREEDTHAYLSFQSSQIMLAWWTFDGTWEPWYPEPLVRPFGRGVNFQFMVQGVQHIYDRVIAADIKPFRDLYTAPTWKTDRVEERRQFIVLDPDGYALRFSETISHTMID